ncbi:MAG: endo alpha-1,4 polygalactosaminidase [bacterium]
MLFASCAGRQVRRPNLARVGLKSWVCVYNEKSSPADIGKFDLAVLDADAHPDLMDLRQSDTILLGYVSLCEVGAYRWYWPEIATKSWVLAENPAWGSIMLDVRSREWQTLLLQRVLPGILSAGFGGFFLDTVDTAEYLEKYHSGQKYPGALRAVTALIKAIRARFPQALVVMNRGYAVLNEVAGDLDGVVAESLFTAVDEHDRLRLREQSESDPEVLRLKHAREKSHLVVLTLDYFDTELEPEIGAIVARARTHGFVPYVSTRSLDRVYFFTLKE